MFETSSNHQSFPSIRCALVLHLVSLELGYLNRWNLKTKTIVRTWAPFWTFEHHIEQKQAFNMFKLYNTIILLTKYSFYTIISSFSISFGSFNKLYHTKNSQAHGQKKKKFWPVKKKQKKIEFISDLLVS